MSDDADVLVLIDNEHARLRFHMRTRIVHHELRTYICGPPLRNVLTMGAEVFKRYGAHKWLSDDRGNGPLTAADEAWAQGEWAPGMFAAGWRSWAVVMPALVLGQLNMRRWIATYAALGVTAQPFAEPEPALRWLVAQP